MVSPVAGPPRDAQGSGRSLVQDAVAVRDHGDHAGNDSVGARALEQFVDPRGLSTHRRGDYRQTILLPNPDFPAKEKPISSNPVFPAKEKPDSC